MMEQIEMAAQMKQAVKRFNEAMWKAILEWWRIVVEAIERIIEAWRRWWLYVKLIRWHVPHRVAKFIASRWPRRWLPAMALTAKE